MSLFSEFKKFALRGNMLDLAIGFTVGAAFTTVVKSLVNDVIMPPIGLITGNADFSNLFLILDDKGVDIPAEGFKTLADANAAGVVTLNFGMFLNNCISLLIVAVAMFAIIRFVNRLDEELDEAFGKKPTKEEPSEKKCDFCRSTIPWRASRCPHCTSQLPAPEAVVQDNSLAGN